MPHSRITWKTKKPYFGEIQDVSKTLKTPYEFFCRMMEIYAGL